jgi:hypothetical protein
MTTAKSEMKSSLFQNFAKEALPRRFIFSVSGYMDFFFGVDFKRRGNFSFIIAVSVRTYKKINLV